MMPLGKAAPCWVKLTRRGNTFTGSVSEDGETWQEVGAPVTVEMKADLCAGLAVTAGCRDESKLHTSAFDHVSVSKP
jgi:regulation of enolase protein 1 (concanavalin A-like superfamily)